MDRIIRSAFGLVVGAALLVAGSNPARAQFAGPTPLTLTNGWTNAEHYGAWYDTAVKPHLRLP